MRSDQNVPGCPSFAETDWLFPVLASIGLLAILGEILFLSTVLPTME